jgi:hypothetical protein
VDFAKTVFGRRHVLNAANELSSMATSTRVDAQGVVLKPTAGDPHDALFNVLAINKKSEAMRNVGEFARSMAADAPIDPFGWLGESVSLYTDDEPL